MMGRPLFGKRHLLLVICSTISTCSAFRNAFHLSRGGGGFRILESTKMRLMNVPIDDLVHNVRKSAESRNEIFLEQLFKAFTESEYFKNTIWQKQPYLITSPVDYVEGSYTMTDVRAAVDSEFLEAGRGVVDQSLGGWNMASVSKPRGSSFQEAKLQFNDVEIAMKEASGTIVFNSAGGFIPKLAEVCLGAVNAFVFPCALNMYLTSPGKETSAPPHTDKQDVFVIQTQGCKRWRVYSPPPPSRMPFADPLARGKTKDKLELTELSAPLIDTVLGPGQVLYVPAGFPHTTDTKWTDSDRVSEEVRSKEPSVHLTVGVDTHIWGLTYASIREYAYKRAGIEGSMLTKMKEDFYWRYQSPLPVGFLADKSQYESDKAASALELLRTEIKANFISILRESEPVRWSSEISDENIVVVLELDEVIDRLLSHHYQLVEIFRQMYADVAYQLTPTKMNLSIFRNQLYFKKLETAMEELHTWSRPKVTKDTKNKAKRQKSR